MLISFFSLLAVALVSRLAHFAPSNFHDPDQLLAPKVLVASSAVLLAPLLVVFASQKYFFHEKYSGLGLRKPFFKFFLTGLGVAFILKTFTTFLAFFMSTGSSLSLAVRDISFTQWLPFFSWFLLVLLVNALSEELAYRAFPLSKLLSRKPRNSFSDSEFDQTDTFSERSERNPIWNHFYIWLTAAFLAAIHFLFTAPDLSSFVYRLSFGVLAGFMFYRTRSLWMIFGFHAGWNLLALTISENDWRLGSILHVNNMNHAAELATNIVVPFLAYFAYIAYDAASKRKSLHPASVGATSPSV